MPYTQGYRETSATFGPAGRHRENSHALLSLQRILTFCLETVSTMRTLFGENILSPPPIPTPQRNPFELSFHSSASNASSTGSTQSSPAQHSWLTARYQEQKRTENDAASVASTAANGHRMTYSRRKGNPKLLFMGLKRCVTQKCQAPNANIQAEAANHPSKKSSSRNSPQRTPSSSSPQPASKAPPYPPSSPSTPTKSPPAQSPACPTHQTTGKSSPTPEP
jgi:hypothetical protein